MQGSTNSPSVDWNVQLPRGLEERVLQCLRETDSAATLDALVEEFPEYARAIRAWAEQASLFRNVETATRATGEVATSPAIPENIGPYKIKQKLGHGGFGTVYLATDPEDNQPCAVKVLQRTSENRVDLFEREFAVLAVMDHPAIVSVRSYGVTAERAPYYSMDFIPGSTLDAYFSRETFQEEHFIGALLHVCDALSYLHLKGTVHRDIKPQNILIDSASDLPHAYLVDFGIAIDRNPSDEMRGELRMVKAGQLMQQTLFTAQGGFVGTLGFMAPEQVRDARQVGHEADIYALAATTYLLLTGRFPVDLKIALDVQQQDRSNAVYSTIVNSSVVPPTVAARLDRHHEEKSRGLMGLGRVAARLSRRQRRLLDEALLKGLEKDPARRPQSAMEFGERLECAFGARLDTEPGVSDRRKRRNQGTKSRRRKSRKPHPNDIGVYFVTDREATHTDSGVFFGTRESDHLTAGISTVRQPRWRTIGRMKPSRLERLFGQTGYQHVQSQATPFTDIEAALRSRGDPSGVLLFIHGYNTTFDDAVVRAAQLQADLKMQGAVICFSWPSQGNARHYGVDAALCEESEDHLAAVLDWLYRIAGAGGLHVLAHSMGNRVLLRAASAIESRSAAMDLGQVLLAAADVSQRRFLQRCSAYKRAVRRTIYASKHDRALMGSRLLHARGRVGYIPPLLIPDSFDLVDASCHGRKLWGLNHSGYGDCREIISDISMLIRRNLDPEYRIGMERRIDPVTGNVYWVCIR